jgi:alpha-glucoside transport system permease protein
MGSLKGQRFLGQLFVNGILIIVCLAWTVPTFGLLISSFRAEGDIKSSGWWSLFPHKDFVSVESVDVSDINIPADANANTTPLTVLGATATLPEFQQGFVTPDGRELKWSGTLRVGHVDVLEQRWTSSLFRDGHLALTLENYDQVLGGKTYTIQQADGTTKTVQGQNIWNAFFNSISVTIPATVIPILIAAFAAYGFAWMNFPGRKVMFTGVVALLVVPLQIALIPILRDYKALGLNGTFLAVWLAHTGFGLPLATYLLYNYISSLPRDILESAFIDGASHFTIFLRLILPLSVPALASFAIFQFLWVWNDFLVAVIFLGLTNQGIQVLTQRIQALVGQRGEDWHLLTAAAFVSMVVPLIVFFSLQRYFVRGLMAGSVKG